MSTISMPFEGDPSCRPEGVQRSEKPRKNNKLRVEVRGGIGSLLGLRTEWRRLFQEAGTSPFLSWEWASTWVESFGHNKGLLFLLVRQEDKLVGLLPLVEDPIEQDGARLRQLSFLGHLPGCTDYLDVLALPDHSLEITGALFARLAREVPFDVLLLGDLAADSPSLPLLFWRFHEETRFRCQLSPRAVCPRLRLQGGFVEVLQRSRRAENFTRRLKQLSQLAGFTRHVIQESGEVGAAFARFLTLHEARWAARGGSQTLGTPALQRFHQNVVERLAAQGMIRFEELWLEGACRASIYGLEVGRRFFSFQTGYDPAWARRSVGLVSLGLSLEDALRRGIQIYDFLRGAQPYKLDWSNSAGGTLTVRITRRDLPLAEEGFGEEKPSAWPYKV